MANSSKNGKKYKLQIYNIINKYNNNNFKFNT